MVAVSAGRPRVPMTCRDCALCFQARDTDAGICQLVAADVLKGVRGPIGDAELAACMSRAVVAGGDGCRLWVWRRPA